MKYIKVGAAGFEADMPQLMPCETPRQIRWINFDIEPGTESNIEEDFCYGIQIGDKVICSCCGGIFSIEELNEMGRESFCTNWVSINSFWANLYYEMENFWDSSI